MEEEIDLKEIISIFWNKKIQITIILLLFIAIGMIYTLKFTIPKYSSTTTLVLAPSEEEASSGNETTITTTDITVNSKLVSTYSQLVKSKTTLQEVIQNLGMEITEQELRNSITVQSVKNTELIEIIVEAKDASEAAEMANEIAKVFTQKVRELYNINNVQIVDEAEISSVPSNINHVKDVITFTAIGIVLAIIYAILANMLDTTIKTVEDIEKQFDRPVLVSIPKIEKLDKEEEVVAHKEPKSPISEIFRTLRTNIQFINTNQKIKTLLVTSTFPGEGKSWITSNLAVTFAQTGKKVILIDADLRKGRQYKIFKVEPTLGLSNYLSQIGEEKIAEDILDYVQKTEVENLHIISAGTIPPNPSELLVSPKMLEGLEKLKQEFDMILMDGTPCDLVTDATILARIVDSTMLVTAHKMTKKEALHRVIKSIQNVGGNLTGVILNKIPTSGRKYEKKYYYYGEKND